MLISSYASGHVSRQRVFSSGYFLSRIYCDFLNVSGSKRRSGAITRAHPLSRVKLRGPGSVSRRLAEAGLTQAGRQAGGDQRVARGARGAGSVERRRQHKNTLWHARGEAEGGHAGSSDSVESASCFPDVL